jgi:hypothetical protein
MLEQILELYPDETFMVADGFNDAIIGVCEASMCLIYSVKKSIAILAQSMPYDDAIDHFYYNVCGSYIGPNTPIWCHDDLAQPSAINF